jgi:iron complex transport system substrate-binding protein
VVLTACGSDSGSDDNASNSTSAESVTIDHAFGSTEIDCGAERVVALGWGPAEAAMAVGVEPVAIPGGNDTGADADGIHPWVAEFLAKNNLQNPAILAAGADDPPYEEILNQNPDLILATEAGLTQEQYDRLTDIAPTVAHPGEAWSTPWRETIQISGEALCKPAETEKVVADLNALTADAAAEHPEFKGKSITVVMAVTDQIAIATATEPRGNLLTELGFTVDSYDSPDTYKVLSTEEASRITSDVLLMYFPTEAERQAFEAGPTAKLLPQYASGNVATVVGAANVAAVSPPTALSWPWTIDDFVDTLSAATPQAAS